MTLTIQVPDQLGAVLKAQADAQGVSPDDYVRGLLERDLATPPKGQGSGPAFKTGRGMFSQYGPGPSAEEIEANRAEMLRGFAEDS